MGGRRRAEQGKVGGAEIISISSCIKSSLKKGSNSNCTHRFAFLNRPRYTSVFPSPYEAVTSPISVNIPLECELRLRSLTPRRVTGRNFLAARFMVSIVDRSDRAADKTGDTGKAKQNSRRYGDGMKC